MDASKVQYQTSKNELKIYMEQNSNGIQKTGGREYNKVGVTCYGVEHVSVAIYRYGVLRMICNQLMTGTEKKMPGHFDGQSFNFQVGMF